ncbi:MAG: hypothetical protein A2170_03450, partial [Deltaproteobacteria bacterium RBG_13_53_10]
AIRESGNLIFAGCEGPCFSMATFFSFGIRDLKLNLYFATDADMGRLWRLEHQRELGIVARKHEAPVKASVIVLMSGLTEIPFAHVLTFVDKTLVKGGIIIGETVVAGLFEEKKWDEKITFKYLFEFSMRNPTAYELEGEFC